MITVINHANRHIPAPRLEKELLEGKTYFGQIRGYLGATILITERRAVILAHETTSKFTTGTFMLGTSAEDVVDVIPVNLEILVSRC